MAGTSWRKERERLRKRRADRGWFRPMRDPSKPMPPLLSVEQLYARSRPTNNQCGIYFLWLGRTLMYVGQSNGGLYGRLGSHVAAGKQFNRISFVPADIDQLNDLERLYIKTLKPLLNGGQRRKGTEAPPEEAA